MRNKILVRPHRLPNSTGRRMPFAEHLATHNATHDSVDLHVLGRTYAAVRDLQVVKSAGKLQTEKAALCHCGSSKCILHAWWLLRKSDGREVLDRRKVRVNIGGHNSPFRAAFFAVHSRYTMSRSLRFLQGLGERPEPCKYNVFR
jgi:hypothetical protein